MKTLPRGVSGVAFLLVVVAAWEAAARLSGTRAALFPPPSLVAMTLATMTANGAILAPLAGTLYRLALGFGLGLLPALGLGALMGYSRVVFWLFEPLVELLRPRLRSRTPQK